MKEGTHYVFVEKPSSDFYSVKLLTGEYSGVIYTYGQVKITEDEERDTARVVFQFKIEEVSEHITIDLNKDPIFKDYIGDLLCSILEENEFKIGKT
jgi:hypothetical protein